MAHMNEVIPNLWLGDIQAARNVEELKQQNVRSILSAMRGNVRGFIGHACLQTFYSRQVELDDEDDADILQHLIPSISFIHAELEKGWGVLVHCQAGVSRSATIVAAYLMYSRNLDANAALDMIRSVRPQVSPNDGFLYQLEIFYHASFKVSQRDKTTRMFYLERAVNEVINGEGLPTANMFPRFPATADDSTPITLSAPIRVPRRRIRCKMCRQDLAAREHMLGHGNIGPETPAALTPTESRRPSSVGARRPSVTLPLSSGTDHKPRRPSGLAKASGLDAFRMSTVSQGTAIEDDDDEGSESVTANGRSAIPPATQARLGASAAPVASSSTSETEGVTLGRQLSESLTLLEHTTEIPIEKSREDGETAVADVGQTAIPSPTSPMYIQTPRPSSSRTSSGDVLVAISRPSPSHTAGLPVASSSAGSNMPVIVSEPKLMSHSALQPKSALQPGVGPVTVSSLAHPNDIAAQLFANPKLAALRSRGPLSPTGLIQKPVVPTAPPILADNKCSGYFVEPMKWMEPFLESGQLAGKIPCPNTKCNAKIGNYDWAGVRCSCKEWVVPGFCIHRSKVDEYVV